MQSQSEELGYHSVKGGVGSG